MGFHLGPLQQRDPSNTGAGIIICQTTLAKEPTAERSQCVQRTSRPLLDKLGECSLRICNCKCKDTAESVKKSSEDSAVRQWQAGTYDLQRGRAKKEENGRSKRNAAFQSRITSNAITLSSGWSWHQRRWPFTNRWRSVKAVRVPSSALLRPYCYA